MNTTTNTEETKQPTRTINWTVVSLFICVWVIVVRMHFDFISMFCAFYIFNVLTPPLLTDVKPDVKE
jgi:hypothetical protein